MRTDARRPHLTHGLRVAALTIAMLAASALRAAITVTLTPRTTGVVVGYPTYYDVVLANTGGSDVTVSDVQFAAAPAANGAFGIPSGQSTPSAVVPAGGRVTVQAVFTPSATGPVTLSVHPITSPATPVTTLSVTVLDPFLAGHVPEAGTMQIRHNIVRMSWGSSGVSTFDSPALILLHGAAGGKVSLFAYAPSGESEGTIAYASSAGAAPGGVSGNMVTLDQAGNGSFLWEGRGDLTLSTGVCWIVATGAVNDRRPVLIISYKVKQ